VVLVDDLDNTTTEGVQTVTFSLDGTQYTIDLAEHHRARLREQLAPFVAAARRSTRRIKRPDRALNRAVRAWASEHGIELNALGRIPNSILQQYRNSPS
jgi:hypothetical protein